MISCIWPNNSGSPTFKKHCVEVESQIQSLLLPDLAAQKTTEYVADYDLMEFCERHSYVPMMVGLEEGRINTDGQASSIDLSRLSSNFYLIFFGQTFNIPLAPTTVHLCLIIVDFSALFATFAISRALPFFLWQLYPTRSWTAGAACFRPTTNHSSGVLKINFQLYFISIPKPRLILIISRSWVETATSIFCVLPILCHDKNSTTGLSLNSCYDNKNP